ncbi:UDP-N-acetylmuramoyl-L-alanyl-D-glutamate--2,6-diaminopimelate ligase [Euzebya tangerina]|uniref:UDP-N-acetylmuramoyl-L-alanyl-D-glutamate--2, 6-diaminopimelate ligase n=1 Tax=Euzebya tangerina TaxID=591198 RepID=UPI00196A2886|nr:UDP-N-acetylmuramoyl-L-alanyl-D-glutamate--2,6-diaminopimelate ligase [Euzebya tangerina]
MTTTSVPDRLAHALSGTWVDSATPDSDGSIGIIRDLTHDSRDAGPGVMFAARPGAHVDGHDFAAAATAAGTPAVLVERPLDLAVPQLVVPSVAAAMGPAADLIHGRPTDAITVLGITGTNGKTTTAYLLDAILRADGRTTGLVGTVETRIAGEGVPGVRTTPEATDLHRLFARMRDEGVSAAAIEVSSHGLALGRLGGVRFAATLFTNLSQDHLDFHPDMEAYYQAKASLFTPSYTPLGIVTIDDDHGRRLAAEATCSVWTLSLGGPADLTATEVTRRADGSSFVADVHGRQVPVTINLPGTYNIANALGAIGLAHAAGVDLEVAARGLRSLPGVPGRMERVDAGQDFEILVDYAHTPDSVAGVLAAARAVASGRLVVVLGCGGNRDQAKRPMMARAAQNGADVAIFTSDNPRTEDPEAILDDMVAGLSTSDGVTRITDRRAAIAHAVDLAAPGDVIVIAGKGHEPYQELADGRIDFDDRLVARESLAARSGGAT